MKKFLCLALSCLLLFAGCAPHEHTYSHTTIPPTCTEMGYTAHTCQCGDTYFSDYRATLNHTYGNWVAGIQATLISGGEEYHICKTCGYLQTRNTENTSSLPKVYLSSDGTLSYSQQSLQFTCESGISHAFGEGKIAFDLSFSKNGASYPVDLGWGERSTYRLDPCVPDLTYARAAAAEVLWNACFQLRNSASETPEWYPVLTDGGFPVQVYKEDRYLGLYRLTPPDGDWAYAYEGFHGSPTAVIRADAHSEECLFLANPSFDIGSQGFSVLYCSTESTEWAQESFGGFSRFIRQSSDDEMRKQLSQYTDLTTLMDHFLLSVFFGSGNGDTEGTLWSTADGVHWTPSFSSLHTAYGLSAEGKQASAGEGIPEPSQWETLIYEGDNLLWQRLCKVFGEELKVRYAQLRATVLRSPGLLFESFSQQQNTIEPELLAEEQNMFPVLAGDAVAAEVISRYIHSRISEMDHWLGYRQ